MLAAICFNTTEQTLVHALGPDWPPFVQLFWRQGIALILLTPFFIRDPLGTLRTPRLGLMAFRSAAAMTALTLSIYGFSRLPIANANALTFTRPLWVGLLAVFFLHERMDRWRAAATFAGFAGVLVMLQPGGAPSNPWAQAAMLGASLLFAASFVSIKSMTSDNRTVTILLYGVLFGLIVSAGPALLAWRTPSLHDGLFLATLGVTSLASFACFTKALLITDAALLAPLDYLRLPLTVLLGLVLFSEQPALSAMAGASLIVASSVVLLIRERRGRA